MVNILHPRQKGPYQQLSILKSICLRLCVLVVQAFKDTLLRFETDLLKRLYLRHCYWA